LDQDDYLEAWTRHDAMLKQRSKCLNAMKVEELHFYGPGTDLRVRLSPLSRFAGGTELSATGIRFEPNIPTEECFTTPDWRGTEGRVRATRTVQINGKLIQGLEMRFERGRIVDFTAKTGAETFETYISSDEGARQLGEVALVGIDSPIYQSGLVFEEILFDENAACHIAVGSAYKFCLEGSASMNQEELQAIGCNESSVHTDIMISSEEVNVRAKLRDGSEKDLLVRGSFVGDLA
jgi:aminopeptidase